MSAISTIVGVEAMSKGVGGIIKGANPLWEVIVEYDMKIGIGFIILGFLGLLHQGLFCGEWWNWSQFWHHETLIAICIAFGLGIIGGRL